MEKSNLALPDSDIWYYPGFLSKNTADLYFGHLKDKTPWQQDDIKIFGKVHAQPRLTAFYANNGKNYSYSNITMRPKPFPPMLMEIKNRIVKEVETEFTCCLLNLYRDGKDGNGWHSDDERELGKNPVIASISLGTERFFHLRHKLDKNLRHKILLEHGSLLLMQGKTQHCWQHQIAKTQKKIGKRINLTFRTIS